MNFRASILLCITGIFIGCYQPQRDCARFRTGTFTFTTEIDGTPQTTTFFRNDSIEVDYFQGGRDTSSVRWINDCEYIVSPLNRADGDAGAIHMKILSTTDNSYIFEYGLIGSSKKSKGTAIKTH